MFSSDANQGLNFNQIQAIAIQCFDFLKKNRKTSKKNLRRKLCAVRSERARVYVSSIIFVSSGGGAVACAS